MSAALQVKPIERRIPLTDVERAEAQELLAAFASGMSTSAEKARLKELSAIAYVNGDSLFAAPLPKAAGPAEHAVDRDVLIFMQQHGGGWARQLASLWLASDAANSAKLLEAFGDKYRMYVGFMRETREMSL